MERYFESVRHAVAVCLRDFPELRPVSVRMQLWQKVCDLLGERHNPETVYRMARHLQNDLGMYGTADDRLERREEYRSYFKGEQA